MDFARPTYAATVTHALPTSHSLNVARQDAQCRKILVDLRKQDDSDDMPLAQLNEQELVKKAALALDIMRESGHTPPTGLRFLTVKRLRHGLPFWRRLSLRRCFCLRFGRRLSCLRRRSGEFLFWLLVLSGLVLVGCKRIVRASLLLELRFGCLGLGRARLCGLLRRGLLLCAAQLRKVLLSYTPSSCRFR